MWTELSLSLERVIEAIVGASVPMVSITEAEIDFPLEVAAVARGGRLVFFGSAPHSRWVSGFLPDVHMARLRVCVTDDGT